MAPLKIAVLVSGRGSNLQAIMESIKAGRLQADIRVVVSNNAGAYALKRAKENGIPVRVIKPGDFPYRTEYDRFLARVIQEYEVDFVVLAGYMLVLTPVFLEQFPYRVINIHPALLPSFPGTHAQKQALDYGVKVSGCTVHFVDHGVDTGPIIAQRVVPVRDNDTEESLAARILEQEHQIYPQVLQWIGEGRVQVLGRKVVVRE